jgi:hypothetical protein
MEVFLIINLKTKLEASMGQLLCELIMEIAVVSLIAGFAIYFNSPSLNTASSEQPVERICPIFIFYNSEVYGISII